MRTEKVKIFTFDELSKAAQKKAIEKHRDFLAQEYSGESELEFWKEELAKRGLEVADIHYRGFYSQGDGASFDAKVIPEKFCKYYKIKKFKKLFDYIDKTGAYFNIGISGHDPHYVHEYTRKAEFEELERIDISIEQHDAFIAQAEELAGLIEAERLKLSKDIYKNLRDDYEGELKDENVIDNIKINEYEFYADGGLYYSR
mgnify:CR=1 FL=1